MRNLWVLLLLMIFSSTGWAQNQKSKFPTVVANFSLTGQTNTIPATALINFVAQLYRVNVYWDMIGGPPTGCNSSIAPTFNWTDETNQVQQFQLGLLACSDTGNLQGTFAVHGLKGTPLTFTVLGNSGQGFQYDVYVTVEQLQ